MLVAAGSSCKKNLHEESSVSTDDRSSLNAGHPIYDVLGYGYDVTGRVANSISSRLSVIDVDKFASKEASALPPNKDVETYFKYNVGENVSTYASSFSQRYNATAGLKVFSGELNYNLRDTSTYTSKYIFSSMDQIIKQKQWRINSTTANLRDNYLTAHFSADVVSLSARDLVTKYGTHVLTDIKLGAKLTVSYRAESSNSNRVNSALAGLKFNGLAKIFGINATFNTENTETLSNYNQTLFYNTLGGDGSVSLIGEIKLDNSTTPSINISEWQRTCTQANAVLIDIAEDGLLPLNLLIKDQTKSEQVRVYINQYLASKSINMRIDDPSAGAVPFYAYSKYANGTGHYIDRVPGLSGLYPGGIAFKAFTSQVPGTQPVYEFEGYYSRLNRYVYLYQFGATQTSGFWKSKGIKFYAYPTQSLGTVQAWGYNNSWGEDHYFATDNLTDSYWSTKWPAFFVFPRN